jgi:hypothetical protein
MSIPTMEELYAQYESEPIVRAKELFELEVAFYYGWMAALDAVEDDMKNDFWADTFGKDRLICEVLSERFKHLRDIANADMAATIGG